MTKNELLRELYLLQHGGRLHGDPDPDTRFLNYSQFLLAQGLTRKQVTNLLLLATTYFLKDLPNSSPDPLPKQIEDLLLGLNKRSG